MKTILRNLFYTLKRFQLASLLNLMGLSTAFAAFIIIFMKVSYERNFDTCYPEPDRIVWLNYAEKDSRQLMFSPRGPIEYLLKQLPGIECGSIYGPAWRSQSFYTDPNNKRCFNARPFAVHPDFAHTIGLEFVEGNAEGMQQTESAIVSESYARKLFPDGHALGSYLYLDDSNWLTPDATKYRICGIFRDLPENCQFQHDLFVPIGKTQIDDWGSRNFYAIFRMKPGVSVEEINRQIAATDAAQRTWHGETSHPVFTAIPIRDLYYNYSDWGYLKSGSRSAITLLTSIAFLIILIAAINLINFSTALAPMRMRSINTQKVLGSSNSELRWGLTAESVCMVFISWLLSLGIVEILIHLHWLTFLDFTPSLLTYRTYVLLTGLIAIAVGLIAGLYPAWYMTSFPPALVLKGNYALSGKGKRLRQVLIGFQYIVSFTLMVTAGFIVLQNRYMRQRELGFEKDLLIVAQLSGAASTPERLALFETRLKAFAEVEGVAYSDWALGTEEGYSSYAIKYRNEEHGFFLIHVSPDFCQVMEMEVLEGEDFQPGDSAQTLPIKCIATESFHKVTQLPVGEVINFTPWSNVQMQVRGYVSDVLFTSLKTGQNSSRYPYLFCTNPCYTNLPLGTAYIRIKAGSSIDEALLHIRQTLDACFPEYPAEVNFFDELYGRLYQQETKQQHIVTLFSLLAVLISLVGVFGLVIFEAEYRRKEIGVRKIYGATTSQILWMFGRSYLALSVASSVIAAPIAWYGVRQWQQSFAEKVPLSPWVFLAVCLLIGCITLLTITVQNYRAATANPVDSLKAE